MLLVGDLGFSSLVLVLSLVLPLIGFFVRRKWRLSVARQAEIQRLLILASEETARAELEATVGYGAVSISCNYHQCAVCYSPTTTRCARCKAVRYCSPKCQIIHWRQGHKEECYPPPIVAHQNHDEGGDYGQKPIEQGQYGNGYENEENLDAKLTRTSSTESALFNSATELALLCSSTSSAVLHGKDDDAKVELHADGEGLNSASESSSASFSGFSSSVARSESSDDVSVCESISSNEPDKVDSSFSTDANLDTFWTSSVVNNLDQTNPSSPKFVRLVDSVDKFSTINKLNQSKPDQSGESQCRAPSFSESGGSDMHEESIMEGSRLSSGCWDETLESVPYTNVADNECFNSYHKEGAKGVSLDSGSSLLFSFSLPGSASSSHPHSSNMKDAKLDNAPQGATNLGHAKLSDGVTLSENAGLDSLNVRNLNSPSSERANQVECWSNNISRAAKPKEVFSTDVPLVSGLSSSCIEKSGYTAFINRPSNASQTLKSSDYSSNGVHVVPSVKSGKIDDLHANVAKLPKVSSSPNCKNGLKTSMLKVVDQFRGSKLPKHHQLGADNEEIFSYESFVKLYSWNKGELQPRGLINCGNSCYANAVLQCLTFTPPLTAYFRHGLHSKACAKKEWCFMCEFENLILKAKDSRSPLSPIGILSQLQNIGSQLSSGKEEDAHEFLRYAIDAMQSVCLKEAGVVSSSCLEEESTLIGLTFGGYLRSKIKCIKCLGKSEHHERMMDLTVEIEGDITTLEEALRRFTRTEILDGENKYQCSRCNSYEKAKKKLTILEAPNVLTIALKRFQSGKFGKLNKAIRFPEILNLTPYMSGTNDKSPIYKLYGVVVHLDIMNAAFSGHYLCYVKNAQNKWFKIDDSTVTPTEVERVLTKGAYMLLYARCSPRSPRSMRNRNKAILLRVNSKNPLKSSSLAHSGFDEFYPSSIHRDAHGSIGSFYSKYNHLQRILEDSSSSDSSLFSSNSDEGSFCTDSTRDFTSADDLLDSIFGDSIHGYNSPWRSSDSDASSSSGSSPL